MRILYRINNLEAAVGVLPLCPVFEGVETLQSQPLTFISPESFTDEEIVACIKWLELGFDAFSVSNNLDQINRKFASYFEEVCVASDSLPMSISSNPQRDLMFRFIISRANRREFQFIQSIPQFIAEKYGYQLSLQK